MRLAAIYVKGHYLFEEDTIMNFGGEYIYNITRSVENNELKISRQINNSYIANFFGKDISLVSAIVGSNGAGKTSLINSILLNINNTSIGIIDCDLMLLIFEDNDTIKIVSNSNRNVEFTLDTNELPIELLTRAESVSTIFYTPILDIRELYINFTNSHFIDVSKYRLFQNDTEDENGSFSQLSEYHLSENLKRWITINGYLGELINGDYTYLPTFKKINIKVNRVFSLLTDFHDTSYGFRDFAKKFYTQWQNEYHGKNVTNRKKLELNIILAVIEKTFNILERTGNIYLSEGVVKINIEELNGHGLKDSFYMFLDNHFFEKFDDSLLPVEEIKELIELLINDLPNEDAIQKNRWDEYDVDFDTALNIIKVYHKFIKSFTKHFTLDKTIMLTFKPDVDLSTGEKGLFDLFSSFYDINQEEIKDDVIIFIDEGETSFHPDWKRKFVNSIIKFLPKIFVNKKIQIIFSTHDALTLSDMPTNNIVYLKKYDEYTKVLIDDARPKKSFGANITDLLADSFFINDGLIGDFAKNKIQKVIKWLNSDDRDLSRKDDNKKIIEMIDEPILRRKLSEMYSNAVNENLELELIEKEIRLLEERKNKIQNK